MAILLSAAVPVVAEAPPPLPNVLLVVVDALRADHLGAYGYARPTSPNIDALARHGMRFTRAYSTTSWTLPAVASLFTGARPKVLRSEAPRFVLPGTTTLATALRAAGYDTAAFVANPILREKRGFGDGFDIFYTAPLFTARHPGPEDLKYPAAEINRRALAWLKRRGGAGNDARAWFLYLHYMEPHHPYVPGVDAGRRFWRGAGGNFTARRDALAEAIQAYASKRRRAIGAEEREGLIDLYDAAIAEADAALGDLLQRLGPETASRTILCVTADHGEAFADHGDYLHARSLYEELIRVPLLLIVPWRQPRGAVIDGVVQLSDVAPTLLELAGQEVPSGFEGRSLLAGAGGDAVAELEPRPEHLHVGALVRGDEKLIVGKGKAKAQLFDLSRDPGEQRDLAAQRPAEARSLAKALAAFERSAPQAAATAPKAAMDPASREAMRALGYLP